VLPELTAEGDLPPGVHLADWQEFQSRFCRSTPRRVWLGGRLRRLVDLASINGRLRRVFVWGSFVTAKAVPKDLDILLIMGEDFQLEEIAPEARAVFNSVRAKLLFESDVFWARASIGMMSSSSGSRPINSPDPFGNAVLWNWNCHDCNRRTNAAGAGMCR